MVYTFCLSNKSLLPLLREKCKHTMQSLFLKKKNEIKEFNVYDIRKKKEESERIKAIRAEQRLAAEKEEDDDDEEDEEDSKPRKKKSKKPKEEVRNWNLGVSQNTRSYSPMCTLYL